MSLFRLRRKSIPPDQDVDDLSSSISKQRHWLLRATSPKKGEPALRNMTNARQAPQTCIPEAMENSLYPRFDKSDPEHESAILPDQHRAFDSGDMQRGRIQSIGGTIKSIYRRSRSLSRSLSPKRTSLHDFTRTVASSVKPSAGIDSRKATPEKTASNDKQVDSEKGLRQKMSIRFQEEDGTAQNSAPIPIPRPAALVLPPLEMPHPDLLEISRETLTGRPPDTPILDPASALVTEGDQMRSSESQGSRNEASGECPLQNLKVEGNPFDDNARISQELQLIYQRNHGFGLGLTDPEKQQNLTERTIPLAPDNRQYAGHVTHGHSDQSSEDEFDCDQYAHLSAVAGMHHFDRSSSPELDSMPLPERLTKHLPRRLDVSRDAVSEDKSSAAEQGATLAEVYSSEISDMTLSTVRLSQKVCSDANLSADNAPNPPQSRAAVEEKPAVPSTLKQLHQNIEVKNADPSAVIGQGRASCTLDLEHKSQPAQFSSLSLRTRTSGSLSRSPQKTRQPLRFVNSIATEPAIMLNTGTNEACGEDLDCRLRVSRGIENSTKFEHQEACGESSSREDARRAPANQPSATNLSPHNDLFTDQHGWSPLSEGKFLEVALRTVQQKPKAFEDLVQSQGGFSKFWKATRLPPETAPRTDTRGLSSDLVVQLVQIIRSKIPGQPSPKSRIRTWVGQAVCRRVTPFMENKSVLTDQNYFAPLADTNGHQNFSPARSISTGDSSPGDETDADPSSSLPIRQASREETRFVADSGSTDSDSSTSSTGIEASVISDTVGRPVDQFARLPTCQEHKHTPGHSYDAAWDSSSQTMVEID